MFYIELFSWNKQRINFGMDLFSQILRDDQKLIKE